jgi:hypothetical protein
MPEQTPTVGMERKLAAIFSTDVAGYSRLMGDAGVSSADRRGDGSYGRGGPPWPPVFPAAQGAPGVPMDNGRASAHRWSNRSCPVSFPPNP